MTAGRRWAAGLLWAVTAAALPGAPIIPDATIQLVAGSTYRYTYDLSGVALMVNQELLIVFDRLVHSGLTNGVAPQGGSFDLVLLPPNNPPGADGGYSLVALVNQPAMTGTFSVEATYTGQGAPPAGVVFEINQLDAGGGFVSQIVPRSGSTGVPEPGTYSMLLLGSMAVWAWQCAAQRSRR